MVERVDALAARRIRRRHAPGLGRGSLLAGSAELPLPHVAWEGDFYAHHSLAGANRALAGRLAAAAIVSVTPLSREAPPFSADTALEVERIVRSRPPTVQPNRADVVVRHRWPPDLSSAGSSPFVLMQPWEFGGIPSAWIPQIQRNVSEVWCGTTWVKECYVRSGVPESKVAVVSLRRRHAALQPGGPSYPLATTKSYKLLFVGGTIQRKGIDVLLRAYLETFSADDDVCLVVKAFGVRPRLRRARPSTTSCGRGRGSALGRGRADRRRAHR